MSTQGRTSDQAEPAPQSEAQTATPAAGEGTNLLHRWVRLVQQSTLWGNDAGKIRLDELASGPTTPRIQTLEEIRAARTAAVADEEAAEGAESPSWWEDAVCTDDEAVDEVCETGAAPPVEEPGVCALDVVNAEAPSFITLPPPVTPVLPAAGEGLLSRILAFGARWLGPVVVGMWPKPTAPPELTDYPDVGPVSGAGPDGGLEPVGDELPKDDNKCEAEEVKHRGGDKIHDTCADSLPGNQIPGRDLLVTTPEGPDKNFDAYTPADNSVWEVKTHKLDDKSARSFKFLAGKEIDGLKVEQQIANRCGYNFKISVSDLRQYELLRDLFDVVYRPECIKSEPDAPAEQVP